MNVAIINSNGGYYFYDDKLISLVNLVDNYSFKKKRSKNKQINKETN